jgi:hypothetical protein
MDSHLVVCSKDPCHRAIYFRVMQFEYSFALAAVSLKLWLQSWPGRPITPAVPLNLNRFSRFEV